MVAESRTVTLVEVVQRHGHPQSSASATFGLAFSSMNSRELQQRGATNSRLRLQIAGLPRVLLAPLDQESSGSSPRGAMASAASGFRCRAFPTCRSVSLLADEVVSASSTSPRRATPARACRDVSSRRTPAIVSSRPLGRRSHPSTRS
jgi:hypothetical protein